MGAAQPWPRQPLRAALAAIGRHPRHLLLAALVAGLLAAPAPAAVLAGCAGFAAIARTARIALAVVAAVLAGAAVSDARREAMDRTGLRPHLGETVTLRGFALERPRRLGRKGGARGGPSSALVRIERGPGSGEKVVVVGAWPAGAAAVRSPAVAGGGRPVAPARTARESAAAGADRSVAPGREVEVEGRLEPLGDRDGWLRRRGAHARVEAWRIVSTGRRRGGIAGALDRLREGAERAVSAGLDPPRAALARGMVLGQDEALDEEAREDFRASGLAHLLAASGQNVMLLVALALPALSALGLGLRGRLAGAIALIALYVPLAGAGPSIQRAGVMGAAGLVAVLASRPASRWYALLLAGAVTLLADPRAAADPGWQLSFAAVLAILLLATPLAERLRERRVPRGVAEAAALTCAATLGTAPLLAFHFERVSLVSLPANLLAVVAVGPVMWLGMVAIAAGAVAPPLAALPNLLAHVPLAYLAGLASAAADVPHASVGVRVGSPAALAAAYAALAASAAAIAWRRSLLAAVGAGPPPARAVSGGPLVAPARDLSGGAGSGQAQRVTGGPARDLSGGGRSRRVRRLAAARAAVIAAAVAVAAVLFLEGRRMPPPPDPRDVVVSFLDVGQGDATLVQHGGATVLVDAGPPGSPLLERLRAAGVRRIDLLVLTHSQADHDGGAADVLRRLPVGHLLDGGEQRTELHARALEAAATRRVPRSTPDAGQTVQAGPLRLRILWPRREAAPAGGDPNDRAIVAHLRAGAFDLLLPADAESNVTAALDLPRVEALKVAHHGSDDPGTPDLVARLRPRIAVIEVGRGNSYGHPTPSLLAALKPVPAVHRTDLDGTVRLTVRAGRMTVATAR